MKRVLPALVVLSALSILLGVYIGSVSLSFSRITESIALGIKSTLGMIEKPSNVYFTIIWEIRFPRVLLAYLVGLSLASAGVASQALFKNPLADPYILGISGGAAVGVALAALYFPQYVESSALIFSLFAVFLVYNVSKVNGHIPVDTLLLAGIAFGFLANAATSYLIYINPENTHATWLWLMGSFNGATWGKVGKVFISSLLGFAFLLWRWKELNLLLFGEESIALGLDLDLYRKLIIFVIAMMTALAVSASGIIGFIGLVSPHIMRMLVGPNHKRLLPTAALFGGFLTVSADLIARTINRPQDIPVGIITALIGAPFFLYLLMKHKRGELSS